MLGLRETLVAAVAVLAGLALVLSGTVAAAGKTASFETPSRKIVCLYSSGGGPGPFIRCDALFLNDVGFFLDRRHKATRIHVTDTVADPNRARVLRYGKSRRLGPFRCRSRPSGLTCTSRTSGHGFKLSRERQRVF